MRIKCFSCNEIFPPEPPIRRDDDGLDIFACPECNSLFKVDLNDYLQNRQNENYILRTFDWVKSEF